MRQGRGIASLSHLTRVEVLRRMQIQRLKPLESGVRMARGKNAERKGKTLGLQKSAAVVIWLTRRAATAFQIFCTFVN